MVGQLWAKTGSRPTSFDHLVGRRTERRWHNQAERLGGLEIDDQFDLGRLFDRKVGRFGTLENLVDVIAGVAATPPKSVISSRRRMSAPKVQKTAS